MTQIQKTEKHLLEKRYITTLEAFKLYNITRLSQMIFLLKKKYFINPRPITAKEFSEGKTKTVRYVVYEMEGAK